MKKPPLNILVLVCDQLSAQALPAWGNRYASTPHLNALLASGVRFDSAYCNCPLCQPSRASYLTSRYPHQNGVLSNGGRFVDGTVGPDIPTLGSLFRAAGYEAVHFGKQHDAGALRGFDCAPIGELETTPSHPSLLHDYDTRRDRLTGEQTVNFLQTYAGEKPFLAVADFNNPHNICGWIGANQGDAPLKAIFDPLPDLPDNLYLSDAEFRSRPLPIQYLASAHRRQAQMSGWDELKIRHYLHAYHHYLSLADTEIGRVLATLRDRGDYENTLIVFFADHGDSLCGRWMATKHTSFYEETMHVPLAFAGARVEATDHRITGLCSLLDVVPTLCEFACITVPDTIKGKSLFDAVTQARASIETHPAVFAQWHTEWGFTIEPGRMVRSVTHKYTHYREGYGEELYDLARDPGEARNLALDPGHAEDLLTHRELLHAHIQDSGDPYWSLDYKADPIYRESYPSYRNYTGPLACDT